MIIVLIGVTGSGKTTVGRLLAQELRWKFYEGDKFHSPANVEKMKRGAPLTDADRLPWLESIRDIIRTAIERGEDAVVACSALKESYRRLLQIDDKVIFVYLNASRALVQERLKFRIGHFMHPDLVPSQFDTLEEPKEGLQIDAGLPAAEIVQLLRKHLSL
ncbi:MAG: gluconokinase [Deltaproteobacteria bacterium]|nr:gluconokinase [Deltaproteobacteria bacterium]